MIELHVLGTVDLRERAGGKPIQSVLAQPRRLAVLAYLAVAHPRSSHRRDTLLGMFWPESSEERARNSLNQVVFNLRRFLGDDVLVSTADTLELNANQLWCDAAAFEERLGAGDAEGALALYAGDLLPGFHLGDCGEFERWLDSERERLRRRAVGAALEVADRLEHGGNEVGALELLHRAGEWAPFEQRLITRLVATRARLGDRPGALQDYERFRDRLSRDLGIEPSPELQALVASVRAERPATAGKPRKAASAATPPTTIEGRPAEERPSADQEERPPARPITTEPHPLAHSPARPDRRRLFGTRAAGILLAAVLVLAAGATVRARASARGQSSPDGTATAVTLDPQRVYVAAFENRTGDAALDPLGYMAADWIVQGLAQTGIARVVPFSTTVQETPHLRAEGAAPEVSTRTANRQLAQRIGAGLLLVGAYYHTGDEVAFQTQIVNVSTGELVRSLDEIRASPAQPSLAVQELQRRSLGALATFYDQRLASWPDPGSQPSSLHAYQLYSQGMSDFMRAMNLIGMPEGTSLYLSAADRFLNAAALDSTFVTPTLWAVYAYMNAGDMRTAASLARRLEARSLSTWSRAVLDHQKAVLARDVEAEYRAAARLAELSPDSEWLFKLGLAASKSGRPRQALDAFLRMNPDRGWLREWEGYWTFRAELQHVAGDYNAALRDVRAGRLHAEQASLSERQRDWLRTQELWALAALGRTDEVLDSIAPRLEAGEVFALWQLNTTMHEFHAHQRKAEVQRVLKRVVPLARRMAATDQQPGVRGNVAYLLYLAGETDEAFAMYDTLVAERPGSAEFRVRHAMLAATRGDTRRARETASWLTTLEGETLARAAPVREVSYWGSFESWRSLAHARLLAQTGDRDGAAAKVGDAITEGLRHHYLHLHDDPDFDVLRNHPRFRELLGPKS